MVDLSNKDVLSDLIPNASQNLIDDISEANDNANVYAALDAQLELLADNSNGVLSVNSISGEQLVAVRISADFNSRDEFVATFESMSGETIESLELVSFGKNVAIFRFSNSDLWKLEGGSPIVRVVNETNGETFDAISNLSLAASAGVEVVPPARSLQTQE